MSFLIEFLNKNKYYKQTYQKKDYDDTYDIPFFLTKTVAIRMTHRLSRFKSVCWIILYWFEFMNLSVVVVVEVMSMVETGRGGSFQDAIKIFKMLPCIGFVLLAMMKTYKMVRCRNIFENIIYEIRDMWNTDSIDHDERQLIGSALRSLHFMVKGFYFCNNLLLVTFCSGPFWEMVKRYTGHENEKYLQLFYWLPFDPLQPGYYEVMLAVQTWHSILTIWANMGGDLLFVIFLSHITLQFDLLSVRIKKLIYVPHDDQLLETYPLGLDSAAYLEKYRLAMETFSEMDWEEYYAKEIAEIVLRHRALIRLSGDVENVYKVALLVNFINSSVVLCFCEFCSIVVEKWNEFGYKSFLATALSQMWIMCWYGQQLADSTERLSHAIYNSGWYKAPKKIKRSLLIMLLRSQKTVYVTTCGFSNITMASYSNIIKTSWSYFTLLLNIYIDSDEKQQSR
ncbi:hypothetical protein K1T71_011479 [Dendrolimus kikuchii]|uniref:Uncharacterized protein n=1 Tax=Dendrolimus kikuchii TaxID=765133 RepID=A0ACC1CNZ9_9NEOP|nr:hypothetical protein K1T71_011479 [Dendrolimus kikuchii]